MNCSTESTSRGQFLAGQFGGPQLLEQKIWKSNERFKTIFWGHLCDGVIKYRDRYDGGLYHTKIGYKNIPMLVTLTENDLHLPRHFPDGNDFSLIDWEIGDPCFIDEDAGSGFGWIQSINDDNIASVICVDPKFVEIEVPVRNLLPRHIRNLQLNKILSLEDNEVGMGVDDEENEVRNLENRSNL